MSMTGALHFGAGGGSCALSGEAETTAPKDANTVRLPIKGTPCLPGKLTRCFRPSAEPVFCHGAAQHSKCSANLVAAKSCPKVAVHFRMIFGDTGAAWTRWSSR